MPSSYKPILAVFRKEWLTESRTLSGITTTGLICFVSVVILNAITFTTKLNPLVAAGMYWMVLTFSAAISLPRTFLQEEEQGNADFWRLFATPEAVFWGKALFNITQMLIATILMSIMFLIMLPVKLANPLAFALNGLAGAIAIASTSTLAGAIAAPASNRAALSTAISVPLLIFLVNLGISGTATALGEGLKSGENGVIGMIAYAIATTTLGPVVYSKIWKS